jgi:energy-coupling factor transporter ATP-binding protein EcfA2
MTAQTLLGREQSLATLGAWLDDGEVVVLYGPVGVGKSALLRALERRARQRERPCGLAIRTASLADFTQALGRAYPSVAPAATQRQWRGRLRIAAERAPGVLLLDDLGRTGTAFKGALKAVRGMGLGIALAADVDQPRDRDRVRGLALSHREMELTPLHGSSIRALLGSLLTARSLPFALGREEFQALVTATEGLPGRAVDFADALLDPNSWRGGRPRVDWLRTGSVIRAAEHYR